MLKPLLTKLKDKPIILASGSQQRSELLKSVGVPFEVYPSNFEECLDPTKHTPTDFVQKTALGKINDVTERLSKDYLDTAIIIGADTVVVHNDKIFGKPKSESEAFELLKALTQTGIHHVVYTGVVIRHKNLQDVFTEATKVFMSELSDEEILSYIETGEPMGKAGAYAIQGIAKSFVHRIEGDINNVIGLPLCRLTIALKRIVL